MASEKLQPDKSRTITGPGVQMELLATSDDTSGAWSLFKYEAAPGFQGPAPHWHEEMVEGFYILEGEVDFEIDGEKWRAGPDEFVLIPPRTVHTFGVDSGGSATFLIQISPGGFEAYFRELQELIAEADEWPPSNMAPVIELMGRHDSYTPPVA